MEKRPKLVILQAKKRVNLQLFFTVYVPVREFGDELGLSCNRNRWQEKHPMITFYLPLK